MNITADTLASLLRHGRKTLSVELPEHTNLWDGQRILAPRRIKQMVDLWKSLDHLRQESDNVYREYFGGDVVDVGSFHGWYALLLAPKAQAGDRFVLCEPDSKALPVLYANVAFLSRLFPKLQFVVLPFPIGNGSQVQERFPLGKQGHPQWDTYSELQPNSNAAHPSFRVDDVVGTFKLHPSLLKIDVEGAEGNVLQGCATTLHAMRPIVCLELHINWLSDGVSQASLEGLIGGLGYEKITTVSDKFSIRQLWKGTPGASAL